jgi:hypothetical protein
MAVARTPLSNAQVVLFTFYDKTDVVRYDRSLLISEHLWPNPADGKGVSKLQMRKKRVEE